MTFREMFEQEITNHGIEWCRGCDAYNSHRRGFAGDRVIHLDSEIGTRSSLYRALHEVGHVVLDQPRRMRRWEMERDAELWARRRMRELGVPVPRKDVQAGDRYVARMKRWGDRIVAGR